MLIFGIFLLAVQYLLLLLLFNKEMLSGKIKIDAPNFILLGVGLYFILPLLDVAIKGNPTEYTYNFLWDCNIAVGCLNIGGALAGLHTPAPSIAAVYTGARREPLFNSAKAEFIAVVVCFSIGLIINLASVFISYGFSYFTSGYDRAVGSEPNVLLGFLTYYSVGYALIFNNKILIKTPRNRIFALITTALFALLYLVGGHRNMVMLITIGAFFAIMQGKKINILIVAPLLSILVLAGGFIAAMRNYSVWDLLSRSVQVNVPMVLANTFSINEFGTSMIFSYYEAHINEGFVFPHANGFSYILGPLINLIPRALWPDRPLGLADLFSQQGYGKFIGYGLGFSPIFEAKVNFNFLWGGMFIFWGWLLRKLSFHSPVAKPISTPDGSSIRYVFYGAISCVMFNFFRIDFAICVKFIVYIMIFAYLLLFALRKCRVYPPEFHLHQASSQWIRGIFGRIPAAKQESQ